MMKYILVLALAAMALPVNAQLSDNVEEALFTNTWKNNKVGKLTIKEMNGANETGEYSEVLLDTNGRIVQQLNVRATGHATLFTYTFNEKNDVLTCTIESNSRATRKILYEYTYTPEGKIATEVQKENGEIISRKIYNYKDYYGFSYHVDIEEKNQENVLVNKGRSFYSCTGSYSEELKKYTVRVDKITHTSADNKMKEEYTYTYNSNGLLTKREVGVHYNDGGIWKKQNSLRTDLIYAEDGLIDEKKEGKYTYSYYYIIIED